MRIKERICLLYPPSLAAMNSSRHIRFRRVRQIGHPGPRRFTAMITDIDDILIDSPRRKRHERRIGQRLHGWVEIPAFQNDNAKISWLQPNIPECFRRMIQTPPSRKRRRDAIEFNDSFTFIGMRDRRQMLHSRADMHRLAHHGIQGRADR